MLNQAANTVLPRENLLLQLGCLVVLGTVSGLTAQLGCE